MKVEGEPTERIKGLVVCIPAFDEEKTIARTIVRSQRYAEKMIVCDDGSTDATGEIAEALGVVVLRHERNKGKGASLKSLVDEARRFELAVLVTIDADGQHDPSEIPQVAAPIVRGEADLVIGVRRMKSGIIPRERIVGNRLLDEATSRKAGLNLEDTQSGFRAYSKKAIAALNFGQAGMAIESQTLIDAVRAGLRIAQVPVSTTYNGIKAKRNPIAHFSSVVDYILSRTIAESPLLYLGIPGFLGLMIGIVAGIRVIDLFLSTRQIAIGTGLVSVILVLTGSIMISTALLLKFLKTRIPV